MNGRDTEVLKIQILADYYHNTFTIFASFTFGIVATWFFVFIVSRLQGLDIFTYALGILVGFILLFIVIKVNLKFYNESLDSIDRLIQQVNRLEPLPSLKELRKKR